MWTRLGLPLVLLVACSNSATTSAQASNCQEVFDWERLCGEGCLTCLQTPNGVCATQAAADIAIQSTWNWISYDQCLGSCAVSVGSYPGCFEPDAAPGHQGMLVFWAPCACSAECMSRLTSAQTAVEAALLACRVEACQSACQ